MYRITSRLKRSKANPDDDHSAQTFLIHNENENDENKSIMKSIDLENLTNLSEFLKDIAWYRQLNHTNLMPLKDCFLFDTKLNLIKPYALFGSCADLLDSNPNGICEQLISYIIWQTAQALLYLQERHIIHRAVASKNIYICGTGRVLLDNFSHCICMLSPSDGKLRQRIYDYSEKLKDQVSYLAPEVIHQNQDGYNLKSDIYSLGIVACELANGNNTFISMPHGNLSMLYAKIQGIEPMLLDQTQLTDEIIEFNQDDTGLNLEEIQRRKFTEDFHSFIKSCVSASLDLRCSFDELQVHTFFKHQIRLSHDLNLLYNDTATLLETYRKKELLDPQLNAHGNILADSVNGSDETRSIIWEF